MEAVGPICASNGWDTLDILIRDDADGGNPPNVAFNNVMLDAFSIGDFAHDPAGSTFQNWTVTGFDFSESFTVSGDLVITGDWNNNEATRVGVIVGCGP